MFISIVVINWPEFTQLVSLDWAGGMTLQLVEEPHGSEKYLPFYILFMMIICVFPYIEENIRCLRVFLKEKRA